MIIPNIWENKNGPNHQPVKLLDDSLLLIVSSLPISSWNLVLRLGEPNHSRRKKGSTGAISQVTRGSSSNRNNRDMDFPVPAARLLNRRQSWHVNVNGFSKKMMIWFWWSKIQQIFLIYHILTAVASAESSIYLYLPGISGYDSLFNLTHLPIYCLSILA